MNPNIIEDDSKGIMRRQRSGRTAPKPHLGFFRVSEEAMRKIAVSFENPSATRAAMLAYVTLCRKANLRNTTTFDDRLVNMAQDMAFPYREAQSALKLLESIGLVVIQRRKVAGTKENAPNVYTVITLLPDATTLRRGARTSGEDGLCGTSPHLTQEQIQSIHTNNV
jgi:hypothetical protein